MPAKITKDVLESYLHCKLKGHLKLTGQQGTMCDYENLLIERTGTVRLAAIDKILARHAGEEIPRNIPLTTSALKQGASFIFDATLEDDLLSLTFDGLKKVEGPSQLGDFHYIPMLFSEGENVRKEQRLLLEVFGLLLSRLQGQMPVHGIIWHGKECKTTKIRLNADLRKTERLLRELKEMCSAESPPKLMLNDHCQVCEFRQRCHAQAVQEDNLSLLRGMGEKEIKGYARKGIFSVTQLAHTFRPRRKGKKQSQESCRHYHALRAMAIRDKKIYVFGTKELPNRSVHIYLDVESDPNEGYIYLIGIIAVENGKERRCSFWADNKEQECVIFSQFLNELSLYDNFLLYSYGGYERTFLKRMMKVTNRTELTEKALTGLVNILSHIYSHIYFPAYSNGLKDIGSYLGCSWTDSASSGIQSIVWRKRWEATKCEGWKQKLLLYNMEDCVALKKVTELVYTISANTLEASIHEGNNIAWVQDVADLPNSRGWGGTCTSDFEYLKKHAFFDYQSQKVYIRTQKKSRMANKVKRKQRSNRKLRVSKRITISCSVCPMCKSTKILIGAKGQQINSSRKRAFDLVLTHGCIRRRVIECRASVHQCLECGEVFIPPEQQRLDKHFHGLKSWAMFLHVKRRISLRTVEELFDDFFGLRVSNTEIHMFKSLMARYYQSTYRKLLKSLLTGNLLHVDETEVNLRTGKGYVWVFTNLEEVVYMYRSTRSADFLKILLKDFRGVLVSDFYNAYDSILCPQQKCLIHLMRDMNQDLLNNPFDEELKSVTQPFGILLRSIVATIDQHGLKRKHLEKHLIDVDEYFQSLAKQSFRSEVAESLRARLLKYQDKLFTFMQHDGVPWNNNNVENAIREFGYYREETSGLMKATGLREYLLFLSLCHTCKFKGISFLRFLLSKEQNLAAYCERKRRNKRVFTIELYPMGFTPPHYASLRKKGKAAEELIAHGHEEADG